MGEKGSTPFRAFVRSQILQHIAQTGGSTRPELMELTGLSRTALSSVVASLKEEGAVREDQTVQDGERRPGRPAGLLVLGPPSERNTLAIQIDITQVRVAGVSSDGTILHLEETTLLAGTDRGDALDVVSALAARVSAEVPDIDRGVLALPVMVDGYAHEVDPEGARARMPTWADGRTAETFESRLGLPCTIANSAKLSTLAEQRLGIGLDYPTFLWVVITPEGIGSGLVIDRRLYLGSHGRAGEVSHISVAPRDGVICPCGQRGCLAVQCAEHIRQHLQSIGLSIGADGYRELADASMAGEPAARRLFSDIGIQVGRVLAGLANTLDPNAIVITDTLTQPNDDTVTRHAASTLKEYAHPAIRKRVVLASSRVGPLAALRGSGFLDSSPWQPR